MSNGNADPTIDPPIRSGMWRSCKCGFAVTNYNLPAGHGLTKKDVELSVEWYEQRLQIRFKRLYLFHKLHGLITEVHSRLLNKILNISGGCSSGYIPVQPDGGQSKQNVTGKAISQNFRSFIIHSKLQKKVDQKGSWSQRMRPMPIVEDCKTASFSCVSVMLSL